MRNTMINFSIKGACSYAWNKNSYSGDFTLVNVVKCAVTLIYTVFNKYEVKEYEVKKMYKLANYYDNSNAIFCENYINEINKRKVEVQPNTMDSYTDKNSDANVNKNKEIDSASFINYRSLLSIVSIFKTQTVSPVEFKKIIKNGSFRHYIHYIVEGNLMFNSDMNLSELPDRLTINGNFLINKCDNLIRLPKYLTVNRVFEHIQSVGVNLEPN